MTFYNPFTDYGGWVDTYQAKPAVPVIDTTPVVALNVVPPPATDARGYSRIFGIAADYGSNELGGEIVDRDGDTMPDWWEWFYRLNHNDSADLTEDPDGDGATNLDEWLGGFHPFVADLPAPAVIEEIVTVEPNLLRIKFRGEAGAFYRLERSNDLINWISGDPFPGAGLAQTAFVERSVGRFWRFRSMAGPSWDQRFLRI